MLSHLGVAADQSDWAPPLQQIEISKVVAVSEKFSSYTLGAIRHARDRGKTTVINGMVGTANQEAMKFLEAADYLFISEKECEALLRVLDMSSARDLLKTGLSTLVVTRGSEGSRWITGEGEFHCDSVPCARVQDTTGAGDCFAGTAIGLIVQGASLREAARIAAAAASYVVEKWGCQTNLVGREEPSGARRSISRKAHELKVIDTHIHYGTDPNGRGAHLLPESGSRQPRQRD